MGEDIILLSVFYKLHKTASKYIGRVNNGKKDESTSTLGGDNLVSIYF